MKVMLGCMNAYTTTYFFLLPIFHWRDTISHGLAVLRVRWFSPILREEEFSRVSSGDTLFAVGSVLLVMAVFCTVCVRCC
jgi:hypothetical protein